MTHGTHTHDIDSHSRSDFVVHVYNRTSDGPLSHGIRDTENVDAEDKTLQQCNKTLQQYNRILQQDESLSPSLDGVREKGDVDLQDETLQQYNNTLQQDESLSACQERICDKKDVNESCSLRPADGYSFEDDDHLSCSAHDSSRCFNPSVITHTHTRSLNSGHSLGKVGGKNKKKIEATTHVLKYSRDAEDGGVSDEGVSTGVREGTGGFYDSLDDAGREGRGVGGGIVKEAFDNETRDLVAAYQILGIPNIE